MISNRLRDSKFRIKQKDGIEHICEKQILMFTKSNLNKQSISEILQLDLSLRQLLFD